MHSIPQPFILMVDVMLHTSAIGNKMFLGTKAFVAEPTKALGPGLWNEIPYFMPIGEHAQ